MKKLTLIVAMAAFVGSFSVMASDVSAVTIEMNGDHDHEKCKKKDCKKCKDKKACTTNKKAATGKSCNKEAGKSCCSKKK
jgi:hypothetical protein